MSTRGVYGFRLHEKDKVTYSQYDSNPEGPGKNVMMYIACNSIEKLRDVASRIVLVDGESNPPVELVKRYKKYLDIKYNELKNAELERCVKFYTTPSEDTQWEELRRNINLEETINYRKRDLDREYKELKQFDNWSEFLRGLKGDISVYNGEIEHMVDSHEFLFDNIFCEWAYIINLDTTQLEVYRGFNEGMSAHGRYAKGKKDTIGVRLLREIQLINITKEVIPDLVKTLEKLSEC